MSDSKDRDIDVKFHLEDGRGKAYVGDLKESDAEMVFHMKEDDVMVVEHTEVKEQMRGKGVARRLLDTVIDRVRDRGWTIIPECEYVRSVYNKEPALRDTLHPQ